MQFFLRIGIVTQKQYCNTHVYQYFVTPTIGFYSLEIVVNEASDDPFWVRGSSYWPFETKTQPLKLFV